jgi:hypothetical protein
MSDIDLQEDQAAHRYELSVDGEVAGFAAYRVRDGVVVITHSEVDRRFRGQGLGNELATRTLDLLRAQGARVLPVCPFFARFVAEHPEYADLVAS